jgi:hypothetical protein
MALSAPKRQAERIPNFFTREVRPNRIRMWELRNIEIRSTKHETNPKS